MLVGLVDGGKRGQQETTISGPGMQHAGLFDFSMSESKSTQEVCHIPGTSHPPSPREY